MEKEFILGEISYITKSKGTIEIVESLQSGLTKWTLKVAEGLQKQIKENEDIKPGLKVAVTFTDESKKEINKITYMKAM